MQVLPPSLWWDVMLNPSDVFCGKVFYGKISSKLQVICSISMDNCSTPSVFCCHCRALLVFLCQWHTFFKVTKVCSSASLKVASLKSSLVAILHDLFQSWICPVRKTRLEKTLKKSLALYLFMDLVYIQAEVVNVLAHTVDLAFRYCCNKCSVSISKDMWINRCA